ncbi:hypothetical protein TREES_T100002659 [Tupaia chinensis]|uniref:Uncharacterized protein n=1 Tax=Tupaia chinensis TaxID=246437 RepID=L9L431_TUPCH|nr:hypothetical protein TREES_T100002659 [Tupaia chinensis]
MRCVLLWGEGQSQYYDSLGHEATVLALERTKSLFLFHDKADDAEEQLADGQLVMAGQGAGPRRLPFHGAIWQRALLDFTTGKELLN